MNSTAQVWLQGRAGKAWVPKLVLWKVLAGSSDKIRSAVAEMRRAISKRRVLYFSVEFGIVFGYPFFVFKTIKFIPRRF